MHKISCSILINSWGWTVVFILTLIWPYTVGGAIPLPGLDNLAKSPYLIPMTIVLVSCSFYLSIPRNKEYDSLLIFSGVMACLSVIGFIFVSVPFGIAAMSLFYGVMRIVKLK